MSNKLTEALARQQSDLLMVAGDLARVIEGFDAKDKTTWGELLNDKLVCLEAAERWASFPDGVLYDENGHVHEELRLAVEAAIKRYPNMEAEQWIGGVAAIRVVADWLEAVKREDR